MTKLSQSLRTQAFLLMLWQLLVIVGLAILLLAMKGMQSALSVLLGGLCYWAPTLMFAWRIFAHAGAQAAKQFAVAFFVGEMVKLFLSAFLFILVAKYLPMNILAMLMGFIGAIVVFWVVCGWRMTRINGAM